MLTGVGVVGGTYFVDSVPTPQQFPLPESTTVFYSDGKTPLAKLGEETRYMLKYDEMSESVKQAIVASEDQTFWENDGVDLRGVARAAWNNFTGGDRQGASTITQQYARNAMKLTEVTYMRKLREAVMAYKLSNTGDDKIASKKQILEFYLNTVSFGRGSFGIEAAARVFFNRTANVNDKTMQPITLSQAMALVLMVKQPEPDPENPTKSPGYDPTRSKEAHDLAKGRWAYVRDSLVKIKAITQEQANALVYPPLTEFAKQSKSNGLDKPVGLVVNHILSELTHSTNPNFKGKKWDDIRNGGYKIYSTINKDAQAAAEAAADETIGGKGKTASVMYEHVVEGKRKNLQAALVAVQPGTGNVLAYYGGHDGTGSDYAGWYYDSEGQAAGFGAHPPGSSFKVYALAAALKGDMDKGLEPISLKSRWLWLKEDVKDFPGVNQIRNASVCTEPGSTTAGVGCSLENATSQSLNVPFFELTSSIGPERVVKMARDAGIDAMWDDARKRWDINDPKYKTAENLQSIGKFDAHVGIGQYPVTVMDHANGMATFAAGGNRATAHFVTRVTKGKDAKGKEKPFYSDRATTENVLPEGAANDLSSALTKVTAGQLHNGWDSASKTGTWQYANSTRDNAHAWIVGYTNKIAAAVWVGNRGAEQAIKTKNGSPIYGSTVPGPIYKQFMAKVSEKLFSSEKDRDFKPRANIGNELPNYDWVVKAPPPPTEQPTPPPTQPCLPPEPCPTPTPEPSASGSPTPNGGGNRGRQQKNPLPPKSP